MFLTTWAQVLQASFESLLFGLVSFIPNLIVAIIIFVVGWLIGVGIGRVVAQVVTALKIDQALRSAGVDRVVERAGFALNSGAFLGFLVKWFFIVVFLVAALDVLHLTVVTAFLSTVVLGYLPQVIAAVLILLVAAVLAQAAERVVAGIRSCRTPHFCKLPRVGCEVGYLGVCDSRSTRPAPGGTRIRPDALHRSRRGDCACYRTLVWTRRPGGSRTLHREGSRAGEGLSSSHGSSKTPRTPCAVFCFRTFIYRCM